MELTADVGEGAGTADTVRFRYDSARQLVGTIDPDPDGAGSLRHRATRTTWRPDGQASKQELGTVNGLSDPDWAAFAASETVDVTFDANNRPSTQALSGTSGGTQALTQIAYDALGRTDCVAVRMNRAVYGSLPASACTLGTEARTIRTGSPAPSTTLPVRPDAISPGQAVRNPRRAGARANVI
jgi:hypothetical protein